MKFANLFPRVASFPHEYAYMNSKQHLGTALGSPSFITSFVSQKVLLWE